MPSSDLVGRQKQQSVTSRLGRSLIILAERGRRDSMPPLNALRVNGLDDHHDWREEHNAIGKKLQSIERQLSHTGFTVDAQPENPHIRLYSQHFERMTAETLAN